MHSFQNDYSQGCHPVVLDALCACNTEQCVGYTEDVHCNHARQLIRNVMLDSLQNANFSQYAVERVNNAQIEFAPGGTMANLLVISSALRPYECVIAAVDGHINVHETGSIEATGHKVLSTLDLNGVLSVAGVDEVMRAHCYGDNYHMVVPRMLYFSFSTEMGMVHTRKQLKELREYADAHNMLIYIDGARLASGLASDASDATLADIISCADAFTFGGTKNGALMGEAIVLLNPEISGNFKATLKQRGALLAKGFLYGMQFEVLFSVKGLDAGIAEAKSDELMYFSLGRHSNKMADQLKSVLEKNGYTDFASDARTNQVFIKVDNSTADKLIEAFGCEAFGFPDDNSTVIRFVCSWATENKDLEELDCALREIQGK